MKIAINPSMKHYPTCYAVELKNSADGRSVGSIYLSPAEIERKNIPDGIKAVTDSVNRHIEVLADTNKISCQYSTEDLMPLYRMVLEREGNEKELRNALNRLPVSHFGNDSEMDLDKYVKDIQAKESLESILNTQIRGVIKEADGHER